MFRVFFALLIACVGAAAVAAEDYADPDKGFKVTVPDGWSKDPPRSQGGGISLVLRSPRHDTTRGTCPLSAAQVAATQTMSQEQINTELSAEINEAFWRAALGSGFPELTIDETGSELRDGRRVYTATARFSTDLKGPKAWIRMKATLQAAPGHIGKAICMSWLEQSAPDDADIAMILGTFESTRVLVIAGLPAQAPAAQPAAAPGDMLGAIGGGLRTMAVEAVPELKRGR
jgi:hypothetical protein